MRVLHLEDSNLDAELLAVRLAGTWPECRIRQADNQADFVAALHHGEFDLILSDYTLQDMDGLAALDLAKVHRPGVPFIFFSGTIGEERAIEALRRGADDYVIKDRPTRLVSAIRQAIERRRTEDQLKRQAELLDRTTDAILVLDPQARVTYWNRGAERLYGLAAADVAGRLLGSLGIDTENHAAIARERALLDGEWCGELAQRSLDGRELVVDSRWTRLLDQAGEPEGILIINTDITRQKEIEAGLLQAQRIESIGLLAGGVAHDMNNMLVPIISGTELAEGELPEGHPARTYLELIRESALHGSQLVRQLLEFSRGTPGHRHRVGTRRLLEDLTRFVGAMLPSSVQLVLAEDCVDRTVECDETQIKQVLVNLCINARDAMGKQGRVNISATEVVHGAETPPPSPDLAPGPFIVISVADTGPGIPPAMLQRIFDPFFTTKPQGKGTGLGLSTSLGIIKSHGGHLAVANRAGGGAVFSIHLPVVNTPAAAPVRIDAPAQPQGGAGEVVLVVDDDPVVLRALSELVASLGYRVVPARCVADAIREHLRLLDDISLVLTDIMMPDGNGFDLIETLHATSPDLPCVAISGLANSRDMETRARELGVTLLSKPPPRQILRQTLHQAIGRSGTG